MGTHHQGTPAEVCALNAYIKLHRAVGAIDARLARGLAEHGVTATQLGVLEVLYHLGPMCQGDIARKQFTSGANITMVVNNLEKSRMVRRLRSEADRRRSVVELTTEGRALIKRMFPSHVHAIVKAFAALSHAEQEELARLCKLLGLANAASSERRG